ITGAYGEWKSLNAENTAPIARRLYHVPYGKMAKKAHRQVMSLEGKTDAEADETYSTEVATSLDLPSQVGNVYTASLYLAFASLMNAEADKLEGQRISFFSYGSGCAAEYFAGTVVEGAGAFAKKLEIAAPLANRRKYSFAEYEAIRKADVDVDRRPVEAGNFKSVAFVGVDKDVRKYQG
ncbi:MAG: hydroxymethylglutaryl-CoA synthase, partial [Polyangia bacterium]